MHRCKLTQRSGSQKSAFEQVQPFIFKCSNKSYARPPPHQTAQHPSKIMCVWNPSPQVCSGDSGRQAHSHAHQGSARCLLRHGPSLAPVQKAHGDRHDLEGVSLKRPRRSEDKGCLEADKIVGAACRRCNLSKPDVGSSAGHANMGHAGVQTYVPGQTDHRRSKNRHCSRCPLPASSPSMRHTNGRNDRTPRRIPALPCPSAYLTGDVLGGESSVTKSRNGTAGACKLRNHIVSMTVIAGLAHPGQISCSSGMSSLG